MPLARCTEWKADGASYITNYAHVMPNWLGEREGAPAVYTTIPLFGHLSSSSTLFRGTCITPLSWYPLDMWRESGRLTFLFGTCETHVFVLYYC